jgi:hypothetical protein
MNSGEHVALGGIALTVWVKNAGAFAKASHCLPKRNNVATTA